MFGMADGSASRKGKRIKKPVDRSEDYVDCSFSESEALRLNPLPAPPKKLMGGKSQGREKGGTSHSERRRQPKKNNSVHVSNVGQVEAGLSVTFNLYYLMLIIY